MLKFTLLLQVFLIPYTLAQSSTTRADDSEIVNMASTATRFYCRCRSSTSTFKSNTPMFSTSVGSKPTTTVNSASKVSGTTTNIGTTATNDAIFSTTNIVTSTTTTITTLETTPTTTPDTPATTIMTTTTTAEDTPNTTVTTTTVEAVTTTSTNVEAITTTSTTTTPESTTTTTTSSIAAPTNVVFDPSFEDVSSSRIGQTNFVDGGWTFSGNGATIASNDQLGGYGTSFGNIQAIIYSRYPEQLDSISQSLSGLSTSRTYSGSYYFQVAGIDGGNTCTFTTSYAGTVVDVLNLRENRLPYEVHTFSFMPSAESGLLKIEYICTVDFDDPAYANNAFLDNIVIE